MKKRNRLLGSVMAGDGSPRRQMSDTVPPEVKALSRKRPGRMVIGSWCLAIEQVGSDAVVDGQQSALLDSVYDDLMKSKANGGPTAGELYCHRESRRLLQKLWRKHPSMALRVVSKSKKKPKKRPSKTSEKFKKKTRRSSSRRDQPLSGGEEEEEACRQRGFSSDAESDR